MHKITITEVNKDKNMIPTEFALLGAAFLTGLLGSIHCIGMCGGIVGTLTLSLPADTQRSPLALLPYLLLYNFGRMSSYVLAGLLVGFIGARLTYFVPYAPQAGMILSGVFMLLLGLYISGWWTALGRLEQIGNVLWRWFAPLGQRFLPVRNYWQALGLGLVWGWLPCGLVYSALALSLATLNTWYGGLIMLAFGLGTLPMLLVMGSAAYWLQRWTQTPVIRRIAGAIVMIFGLMALSGVQINQDGFTLTGSSCHFDNIQLLE